MKIKVDHLAVEVFRPEKIAHFSPLLFVHGAGGTSRYWENHLRYFSAEGWEAYAVNLRGHFPSDPDAGLAQVTLEDYIEDIETVMHRLHIEQCVLIGHSLGGLIVQKAAERNESLSGLVMLCSAPPMGIAMDVPPETPYAGTLLKTMWGLMNMQPVKPTFALAETTILNNIESSRQKEVFDMFVEESLVVGYQVAQGVLVVPRRIRCPKLVIACEKDMVAPLFMQKSLAEFLKADYIAYRQFAHLPMLEKGWETMSDDMAEWMRAKIQS